MSPLSQLNEAKIVNLNKNNFETNWKQIRAQSHQWWSLFSETDLVKVDKAPVKRDKYVVLLQVKYGYTRVQAIQEVSRRLAEFEASQARQEA